MVTQQEQKKQQQKTILFFPLNSPGHINSSLGIADIMKRDYNCRTIFLLLGKMIGSSIDDHGHELVILDEVAPFEDYEIEDGEDPSVPVDEEAKRRAGKIKRKYEGVDKWPQLIRRAARLFSQPPVEAFVELAGMMEKSMVGELTNNHANFAAAIDKLQPDLIIVDAYYIPPCIVNSKVPWVRLYSANPLILVKSKLPDGIKPPAVCGFPIYDKRTRDRLRNNEREKWDKMVSEWKEADKRIVQAMCKAGSELNLFLEKQNCTPLPPGKQAHDSPYLNIYMFPEVLDYDQDDDLFEYPPLWVRCNSLMRQNSQNGSPEAKQLTMWKEKLFTASEGKEAVVYFSLGSLASGDPILMKKYVDYLKHDERKLFVVSKGVNGDMYELNKSNMIGGNYLPQTFFLQAADLAIIHGGNNSITECMYYGKPMIVLPVFADQLDNAQRIDDLGFGKRLNVYDCTQEQLSRAIDEILNNKEMIDRMRAIGDKMRSRDDLEKVTGALRKLIDEGSLTKEDLDKLQSGSYSS